MTAEAWPSAAPARWGQWAALPAASAEDMVPLETCISPVESVVEGEHMIAGIHIVGAHFIQ